MREAIDVTSRSKYKTKQRQILLDYLATVPGVHITAGDVCEYFRQQGTPIGQSTVYRHLESLVDEGLLQKYVIGQGSPACFEFVGEDVHEDGEPCFHCKCEKCGKLIHLHCDELDGLKSHISGEHGFQIDPMRTVFYGLCDECR